MKGIGNEKERKGRDRKRVKKVQTQSRTDILKSQQKQQYQRKRGFTHEAL
jgi:hypothetical protein